MTGRQIGQGFGALLLTLPLAGCFDDQQVHLGKCQYEAQKSYPDTQLSMSQTMARMIKLCMKANGYEFEILGKKCVVDMETEANPYCYRPTRSFEALLFDLEMRLDR